MRSSHFRRRVLPDRRRERCGSSLSGARVMMRPIAIATPNAQVLLAGNTHAYFHTTIRSIVCGVGWNVPNQVAATDICRNPVEAFDNLIVSSGKYATPPATLASLRSIRRRQGARTGGLPWKLCTRWRCCRVRGRSSLLPCACSRCPRHPKARREPVSDESRTRDGRGPPSPHRTRRSCRPVRSAAAPRFNSV